jgi:hypothetical protein
LFVSRKGAKAQSEASTSFRNHYDMTNTTKIIMKLRFQSFVSFVRLWLSRFLCAISPLREPILCFVVLASYAHAENWSRFRGPNGDGQSDDASIPSKWEPENFLWKQTLPGVGHSSPVIWEDNLYLISADAETGAQLVSAFNVHSGAPIWDKKLDASTYRIHKLNSLASSTPSADAEHVYVLWLADGEVSLAAFTHAGDETWRRKIGPFKEQHGFGISPVVVDDVVCIARDSGADSAITAFDCKTGEPRWNLPVEPNNTAFATPCLLDAKAEPKILVVSNTSLGVAAIDASCGKIVWQGFESDLDQRCVASPFIADGKIFVGCGQGGRGKLLPPSNPVTRARRRRRSIASHRMRRKFPRPSSSATSCSSGAIAASFPASMSPPASGIGWNGSAATFTARRSTSATASSDSHDKAKQLSWRPTKNSMSWPATLSMNPSWRHRPWRTIASTCGRYRRCIVLATRRRIRRGDRERGRLGDSGVKLDCESPRLPHSPSLLN